MPQTPHITIYTILGSIPFISKLHLKSIKDVADSNIRIVAFGGRSKSIDIEFEQLLSSFNIEYYLFKRYEHPFNANCIDGNYDYLIKTKKPEDIFITMHDDCILGRNSNIFSLVREKLKHYDFCGKLENNNDMKEVCKKLNYENTSKYKDLIIKGESMHDKRIGTWFLSGKYNAYIKNKLSFGEDMRLINFFSNIMLNNYKFRLKKPYLKLDGGFNFNLKIHKYNIPYFILGDEINILHLVHATNFFVKKGFLNGLGTKAEWEDRWENMNIKNKIEEIKKEKIFLSFLNDRLILLNQPYKELVNLVNQFN